MARSSVSLTPAEWNLMECLWEYAPRTGRDAVEYMASTVGWSRSTTLTMLRRMTEKGIIACIEENGIHTYTPLLCREDAARRETRDFLNRVFGGSVTSMVNAITQQQELSQREIDELYAILQKAEEAKNQ